MVGALLGTGGFAKVFSKTNSRTGEACADKVIEKKLFKEKRSAKAKVEKEILIHRQLDHKHIVRFLRHFEDRSSVHILLELCPSKTFLHVCRCQFDITEWLLKGVESGGDHHQDAPATAHLRLHGPPPSRWAATSSDLQISRSRACEAAQVCGRCGPAAVRQCPAGELSLQS